MAAAITTSATTLEGQLIEVIVKMQELEGDTVTANPNSNNFVSGTFNTDTGNFASTVNLPFTFALVSGKMEATATEYLVG